MSEQPAHGTKADKKILAVIRSYCDLIELIEGDDNQTLIAYRMLNKAAGQALSAFALSVWKNDQTAINQKIEPPADTKC